MGIRYASIKSGANYRSRVFNLLDYLERNGRLDKFVDHVIADRPQNKKIVSIASLKLITPTGPGSIADISASDNLQKLILSRTPDLDFGLFSARCQDIAYKTCRISYPGSGGTGWLIGPDMLITNHHVMAPFIDGQLAPSQAKILFDYRTNLEGVVVNSGRKVSLAESNWLLASQPHAREDTIPNSSDPSLDKLDYAVVRLLEPIGTQPIIQENPMAKPRGWISLSDQVTEANADQDIIIFQHPDGKPLRVSLGRINKVLNNGSRYRYDAVTHGGSSGSAVLSLEFELIALHHAGDPNYQKFGQYNQGIPLHLIKTDLVQKGILLPAMP